MADGTALKNMALKAEVLMKFLRDILDIYKFLFS